MRSIILAPFMVACLAACEPTIPDSAAGVGFGNYHTYTRDQALAAGATAEQLDAAPYVAPLPPQTVTVSSAPVAVAVVTPPPSAADPAAAAIAADTRAILARAPNGLSQEGDFDAVSQTRSIAADAELRRQQAAMATRVVPTALPPRPEGDTPNIVQYALSTTHPQGVKRYPRSPLFLGNVKKNCAAFTSANEAQEAFLAAGGPARDRKGLDPDGDGYACGWDPTPFRRVVSR